MVCSGGACQAGALHAVAQDTWAAAATAALLRPPGQLNSPSAAHKASVRFLSMVKCSTRRMQSRDMLRYNLLKIPAVKAFLRSKLWPEGINFK